MVPVDPSQCGASRKRVVACDGDKLSDEEYILKRKRNNDAVNRFNFFFFFSTHLIELQIYFILLIIASYRS